MLEWQKKIRDAEKPENMEMREKFKLDAHRDLIEIENPCYTTGTEFMLKVRSTF